MKTTHFMIAMAALALASCSQDEPVSVNNGKTIDFRPAIGTQSRASEITNSNLSSIEVTAFMGDNVYFPTLEFSKGSDGFFTSTPEYHWPGDDTELAFYAYAPAQPGGKITIDSNVRTMTDFSPATDLGKQVDFITSYATGTRSANEGSGVELTFNHQLSQIEIRAKSGNDAYNFEVSGIRIGEPVSDGAFDFGTSAWTLGSSKTIYEDTYDTPKTITSEAVSIMGAGGNAMLLPQQLTAWDVDGDAANSALGAYLSVKLKITTAATGIQLYPFPSNPDCDWAAIPIDTNWQPGKKYIYTLDFTHGAGNVDPKDPDPGKPVLGGPIKFTVNVIDWVDTPEDLEMPSGQK